MEFRILRPLQVRADDGRVQHIPQARQREILSVLLLANKPVAPTRLIEMLWGRAPPRAAAVTLRSHISAIRHLAPSFARLETSPVGYLVRVAGRELDLTGFRLDAAGGRDALDRGDHGGAARLLRRALDYWKDPALADVPQDLDLTMEVERLGRERLSVRHSWIDARLALGDSHELVPPLQAWTEDSLDEHLWAQLMLALYRSGRQADALQAHAQIRNVLAAECGINPGHELRDLQRLILAGDFALDLPSRLLAPNALRLWSREIAPPPPGLPPAPAAGLTSGCELPPDVADFTGRAAELDELVAQLTAVHQDAVVPAVAITGRRGTGKTALALHVAHALRGHFPDGQLFLPMSGSSINSPAVTQVVRDALLFLGMPEHAIPDSAQRRADLFRSWTSHRRILVVIDDYGTEDCAPLFPSGSRSAVILTARRPQPDLADFSLLPIGDMGTSDAKQLLGRLIGSRPTDAPGDRLTDDGATGLLAGACGALPLELSIAAAGVVGRPSQLITDVAETAVAERGRLDRAGAPDSAMRTAVSVGYRALDDRARRTLRLLTMVVADDVDGWVIAALLGEPSAADVIAILTQRGLLAPATSRLGGGHRYQLPEHVRRHAAADLDAGTPEEWQAARRRLMTGWLELADLADRSFPRPPGTVPAPHVTRRTVLPDQLATRLVRDPVAWFAAEQSALAAVVDDAAQAGDFVVASRLASYQAAFLYYHDRLGSTVRLWGTIAYHAQQQGAHAATAQAQLQQALALIHNCEYDQARSLLGTAMTALERLGDRRALALGQYIRSTAADVRHQHVDARRHAEIGLRLARQAGDQLTEMLNLSMLGLAQARLGRHRLGELYCGQALMVARLLDEPSYERFAADALACLPLHPGNPVQSHT